MRDSFKRGIAYTFLAQLIGVVLLFAAFAIAARLVSEADLGTFVLLFVAAQFLAIVADAGMTSTIVRFLSAEKKEQEEVASTALGFSLIVAAALSVVVYFVGALLFPVLGLGVLKEQTATVSLLFFFQYHLGRISAFLQGLHLYRRYAYVQVLGPAIRLLLIILLVGFLAMGLEGLIMAAIVSSFVSCLLAYVMMPWRLVPALDRGVLKRLLFFGIPLHINAFLAFIFERADTVLLGAMAGPVSVATYEVAYKLPNQVKGFFGAFIAIFFPHVSTYYVKGDPERAEVLLRKCLRLVSFGGALGTLAAVLYHREIISLIFSSKYASGGQVFAVLMLGVSIGLCNWLMATALIASGRSKATLSTTVPEAAINVGLNLLLIPRWGILGAALASSVSRTAVNPIFLFFLKKDRLNTMGSYSRSFLCLGLACLMLLMPGSFGIWRDGATVMVFLLLVPLVKALDVSDIRAILSLLTPSRHEPVSPMGYTTEP